MEGTNKEARAAHSGTVIKSFSAIHPREMRHFEWRRNAWKPVGGGADGVRRRPLWVGSVELGSSSGSESEGETVVEAVETGRDGNSESMGGSLAVDRFGELGKEL